MPVHAWADRTYLWDLKNLGRRTLYGGPVSRRCSVEWVLGQGFFNTEAEGGPRWATEKKFPSPNKALQTTVQTKRMEVE
jgi:hypothetical protein